MNAKTFNRLHSLRMDNAAAGYTMAELRPRFDRLAGRHENGTAPRAVSAFQLFQTPPAIAARLCDVARAHFNGGNWAPTARILEPSAGLGRILDALQGGGEVVAVEMAPTIAGELYAQNRPGVKILQRDFLTLSPDDSTCGGKFDAVIMNPPFHMRADIRHILHARKFLKAGGILAALCFNTARRVSALRPIAASWEVLPASTFAKEGTHIETVLLTIKA